MMIYSALGLVVAAATASFLDKFGALDEHRWAVSDGWSNGAYVNNDWQKSQIVPARNGLTITFDKSQKALKLYSSGEMKTRALYRYGYFETRMTAAQGSGLDTAFFTYIGPPNGKPWNEVDVEILGKDTHAVWLTYHYGQKNRGTMVDLDFDAAADSHVYGFDWQPSAIRWYIDGKLVHEETGDPGLPLPDEPQNIFVSLIGAANNPEWAGLFTWPDHPIKASYRCVAYAPAYPGHSLC